MSTNVRAEVSKKSKYWIDRHRYYELKHFVLQYPLWKERLKELDGYDVFSPVAKTWIRDGERYYSPVEVVAMKREYYSNRIKMVDEAATRTEKDLGSYILNGILKDLSYDKMNTIKTMPCSRDTYYELYRKFFWLLSELRK